MNNNKVEKIIHIATAILGIVMIIAGIILLASYESHTGYNGGVSRASTSIKFGADYYTTTAQYMALAANAACDIYSLVKTCFSLVFIFAGAFISLKELNVILQFVNTVAQKAKTTKIVVVTTPSETETSNEETVVAEEQPTENE